MRWQKRKLGEFFRIKHGYAFKSQYFSGDGRFIVLTPGHFHEEGGFRSRRGREIFYLGRFPTAFILKKGDLLIAMTEQAKGLLGSSVLIPEEERYLHNQRLGLVSDLDEKDLSKEFLYHLLNSRDVRRQISMGAGGTKVRHTSPEKVLNVTFLRPPLRIQCRFATVLSSWDRAIKSTEDLIAATIQRKLGLSRQLLVGKQRFREFIKNSGTRVISFGAIPKAWGYVEIGDLAQEVSTRNSDRRDLTVLSCTKHRGLVDSLSYFDKRIFSKDTSGYKVVKRGQFVYATNHIEEGSIGYQDLCDEALISPLYTVFSTNQLVNDHFFYKLLKTELYRHIFEVNTSASVDRRGSLRWKQFAKIRVALPSLEEQDRIVAVLEACDKEIELLKRQGDALKRQKRGLMEKLLTGQIRMKVADEIDDESITV